VRNVQKHFGKAQVAIHTMDNYYLPEQHIDENGFKNFDLPTSFDKKKFCDDLWTLSQGRDLEIAKYDFTIEGGSDIISISTAPIIIVEGLFIYYYDVVMSLLDYKVMVQLSFDEAFSRRLRRDVVERNYDEEITKYRYFNHVEPAYKKYISPFKKEMDLIVDNSISLEEGQTILIRKLKKALTQQKV